ncbi:MAG: TMEM165/GDT1 family protein [Candidatus Riflebacteria bacterium]|nr:TMEM165/GDT1 family protein [Candidatus Riflebacteria bacterium]
MDWRLFASTFLAIFLAEVGDKTQLATMALATGGVSRVTVFLGAASALVLTSLLAVLLGDAVTRWVPAAWLRRGAGLLFVVLGVMYLFGKE